MLVNVILHWNQVRHYFSKSYFFILEFCALELTEILTNSRDPKELQHVWIEWRKAIGPKVKEMYQEYVELSNEAARLNNFTNNADYWLDNYETPDFREQVQSLWEQIKPLYLQIHAYVRHHLRKKYGDVVSERGPIPAHLLGRFYLICLAVCQIMSI